MFPPQVLPTSVPMQPHVHFLSIKRTLSMLSKAKQTKNKKNHQTIKSIYMNKIEPWFSVVQLYLSKTMVDITNVTPLGKKKKTK